MPILKPAVWIIMGLVLAVLEMIVPGLVIIWFGVGAIVTGIIALFIHNPYVHYGTFLFLSGLGVFLAQWIGEKITNPEPEPVGALRYFGAVGTVIKDIVPPNQGRVKVSGEEWLAESEVTIPAGHKVRILKVEGTRLIVEPFKKE
jgi:membrane protein implicated in regulation of membrane protease activity